MGAHDNRRRLLASLAIVMLVAGCGGSSNTTPTTVATAGPTATAARISTSPATLTPAPTGTPVPTPTVAPTIGEPADDGARIIAVESPTSLPLVSWVDGNFVNTGSFPVTRARELTIDSPAVGIVQVLLLLPGGFDAHPSTRWPVLYLLAGSGGGHLDWTNWGDAEARTSKTDLLVVIPDQGAGGPSDASFTDWWNGGKGGRPMWETFHLVELRQLLERNWQAGDKRAIAGVSAGGYGAMEYATRHPGMFLFAGSYSGPSHPTGAAWGPVPDAQWGDPVAQADVWKAHDPYLNAAALKGTGLFVSYGNGEPGALDDYAVCPWDPTGEVERFVAAEGAAFVKRVGELKMPVTVYAYGNGTHNLPYFQRAFDRSLPLILKALGE
ncbi:MAG: alpha/beta hydrolase [Acidimicrobiales bacterium]